MVLPAATLCTYDTLYIFTCILHLCAQYIFHTATTQKQPFNDPLSKTTWVVGTESKWQEHAADSPDATRLQDINRCDNDPIYLFHHTINAGVCDVG